MRKTSGQSGDNLEGLIAEHRALDDRVRELGGRVYLTASEEADLLRLKKLKLAKKDAIDRLQHAGT